MCISPSDEVLIHEVIVPKIFPFFFIIKQCSIQIEFQILRLPGMLIQDFKPYLGCHIKVAVLINKSCLLFFSEDVVIVSCHNLLRFFGLDGTQQHYLKLEKIG